jgi:multidrug efflux pump subunit AcrB
MKFTLGQAAAEVGRNKSTISRDIAKGRLSADKNPDGSYLIDAAELFRAYEKRNDSNGIATVAYAMDGNAVASENLVLQVKLESALQRNADRETQLEDLKKDRDQWRQQATYLLEDKTKKEIALNTHISVEQELREKLAKETAQQEQAAQLLADAEQRLGEVRRSWLGRILFKV